MTEGGTLTFSDPDAYAAAFGDIRVNLTITGAGDFKARLIRLSLKTLELYWCWEDLPRIAYIVLPPERVFLSFAVGTASLNCKGIALQHRDFVLHGREQRMHQQSNGACQWGLISLSVGELASCAKALTGREIPLPHSSRMLRPAREESSRLRGLLRQACHVTEAKRKLIHRPEIARALEQELLHAIIHCLAVNEADDHARARHHHAAVMVRFEEALSKRIDQKLNMPRLCTEIGVPERTLRLCCAEFLGVSPTRYVTLRRLNKVRAALQRADPSIVTVAEVARNHQFLELGRFAVTYRTTFGESPSVTLESDR
ncbi:helix-turn-helix domain-containing protein [Bradyrhizobium sp. Ec3.3]|uniref:helix-turn-helix domain-containing protein n=1 Tax=Bradyrhizobium sp. Ec3.3 TaxID=189753 RepID=UPI00048959F5|nr:helix-turn-helix domain-containing protein [Bradyrhizobium sp. Ec3.3]